MAIQLTLRKGTKIQNDAFTGAEAELTYDSTSKNIRIHDGSTQGGYTIPTTTQVSGLAFPSASRYDTLTLEASGTQYTAPADGYVTISKQTNGNNQFVYMEAEPTGLCTKQQTIENGSYCHAFLPVRKGQTYHVDYTAGGTLQYFRFIYAEGAA